MNAVLLNLSAAQKKWVKATGFGWMLEFQMLCYVHRLSYNIVDAFDSQDCSLNLSAGRVKINEMVVHNVLGLPNGSEEIQLIGAERIDDSWDDQYESTQITPSMVKREILRSRRADNNFKWNFLILMYNFFFEANQNSNLTRKILRFSGDIDRCKDYNWCQLLIAKLRTTHAYWAELKKRKFSGPLPFLIVSKSFNVTHNMLFIM